MMPEVQTAISKTANELYLPAFAQYRKHIDPARPFEENLLALLTEQLELAKQKRVERRLRYAGFPRMKTLDMFEMSVECLPYLNFDEVLELAACHFIEEKLDVVALGPSGAGKTHLALAIGYEAIKKEYNVKFKRASDLVNEMSEAKSEKQLTDYLKPLNRCALLIIDEVGYLNYDQSASSLLFQVVGARYETGSTFYTTNLPFSKWTQFIGDKGLAEAMVDRIAHHSFILNMNTPKAWRLEHARSKIQKPMSTTSE
jgi:DNA replication protein DnaC